MGESLVALAQIARHQHGVFTYTQAIECGISPRTVRRYAAEGRWRQIHPGVFVTGGHGVDDLQRASAAVLAVGPTAVVSHMSAVALHDLGPWPLHVHVTVPHGRHRSLDGVRWHQSRRLGSEDLTRVRGIATTTIERTLLDAATHADRDLLARLVDESVRLGITDVAALAAKALDVRPDGRFGGSRLRSVLGSMPPLDDADSVMELVMARLLDAAGLGGYVHHHVVDTGGVRFELDFAYVPERVDVECDGAAYHHGPSRRVRDRQRDEALGAAGWTVCRFSWKDVTTNAFPTARRIRTTLGR